MSICKSFLACALGSQTYQYREKYFSMSQFVEKIALSKLQIMEDCFQRKSAIVTSQLLVAKWYNYINDPTLADAIMDRLTANVHR